MRDRISSALRSDTSIAGDNGVVSFSENARLSYMLANSNVGAPTTQIALVTQMKCNNGEHARLTQARCWNSSRMKTYQIRPAAPAIEADPKCHPQRASRTSPAPIIGMADVQVFASVTTVCAQRTSAASSMKCKRREPTRAMSPE